jgi:hypothetical protein
MLVKKASTLARNTAKNPAFRLWLSWTVNPAKRVVLAANLV